MSSAAAQYIRSQVVSALIEMTTTTTTDFTDMADRLISALDDRDIELVPR